MSSQILLLLGVVADGCCADMSLAVLLTAAAAAAGAAAGAVGCDAAAAAHPFPIKCLLWWMLQVQTLLLLRLLTTSRPPISVTSLVFLQVICPAATPAASRTAASG